MFATSFNQLSDEALVQAYLSGDPKAFNALFERYKNPIFLLVRQYFKQREKAEEIFQEIFMKTLQQFEKFRASGSFRSWLYTLSRNHCIDRIRYYKRRPETPDSAIGSEDENQNSFLNAQPAQQASAEDASYDQQLAQHMQGALNQLPEEQRETFLLKERGQLTFEEISKQMKVSVNTVKSRMRYALSHLRRALKNRAFVKEALE